ncbi:MAG: ATP-binding protein [Paracoccaceae bacterium]|nr:ATP-binding protein [Paracoccaceae bacterium]
MSKLSVPDTDSVAFLDALSVPIWVFDVDRHEIWWANDAALEFWRAPSLADLKARDFSTDSSTVRQRLREILRDTETSPKLKDTWTLYPAEEPVVVTVCCQPVLIEQSRDAVLVELIDKQTSGHDTRSARLVEAVRYSGAMLSMFSLSGELLVQNAQAFECYGRGAKDANDLTKRLGSRDIVRNLLETVERSEVFDAELAVQAQAGPVTHRVKARGGRDPATGDAVVVLNEDDISDVMRLRSELSELNAHLEERVAERSESLRISEERFSLAMQGANDGLWDRNLENGEIYFSPRWLEMLGYDAEAPPPDLETILSLVHPDDREHVETSVIRPEPGETSAPEAEFRIRHQDGHWVDILSREFVVVRDGKVVRIVGTHIDITERKRSERSLRRLKEILFEGSEALPLGVAYYDQDFKLVMNNTFYETMLPVSAHLLERGVDFADILRNSAEYMAGQFGYDDPEAYVQERIKSARLKPQRWVHEQSTGRTIIASEIPTSGNGVISMIEDITVDRARQKQLQQAQKMEAIGQLTGGIAHDFNNLMAVIMGNLELLQSEIGLQDFDVEEANTLIDAAIDAVKHGADLTNSMLAYARKARLEPAILDLNQTVRETERWMRRTIESNIQIETVLQAGVWPIKVDQSSLQSALVNLILNARDSIEGSGKLTIETANLRIDETYLENRSEDIDPGRYVMVAVTDDGHGIAPDVIDQIYDPFFTTKSVGKGTGLGLSMVDGFVRQSGGTVRVYSELGEGTSFKLYFKAVSQDRATTQTPAVTPPVQGAPPKVRPRLLLAEDKLEVMAVLEKTLVMAGYDVTTATTGDIAYSVFKADPSFDVVLTDIVMPGRLQGPQFARECRLLNPKTPFIFLSGYASEATVHGNGLLPEDIRLMKPVSRADLLGAVEKCLKLNRDSD